MKAFWKTGKTLVRGRAVATAVALMLGLVLGLPSASMADAQVDLNEASLEELTSLPGIGPARARAIIERREEAPFDSADELSEVPGIGNALVDKLREHVQVGQPERQATSAKQKR
ncbi:MAG: helix-hairpin-helix domain-containing protein [Candidatus Binatia bacterium]|nr:helix-hairpin-helix domain-containing protein [Candidatus Binatia bacterium]